MTTWPAPVLRMFLGQLTPDAVLAAADDRDGKTKQFQVCEANFYSGQRALEQGAKDDAIRFFRLAASDCPKGTEDWAFFHGELRAQGISP
jgi:lipoprotein NlpI